MKKVNVLFLCAAIMAGIEPALCATITVNTDDPNVVPDGRCSLIEALENANGTHRHDDCAGGDVADTDVINLGSGRTYMLDRPHTDRLGLPTITGDTVINGHGSVIQRAHFVPGIGLINIDGPRVTINDLTLRHSAASFTVKLEKGNANLNRCTIEEGLGGSSAGLKVVSGRAVVNESTISQNRGMGIINAGHLLVIDTVISSNEEGGVYYWSFLSPDPTSHSLTMLNCHVEENLRFGIYIRSEDFPRIPTNATIIGTTIINNKDDDGDWSKAGVTLSGCGGRLVVSRSEVGGNRESEEWSTCDSGGVNVMTSHYCSPPRRHTVEILNSVVFGNEGGNHGGGICVDGATLTIINSTILRNSSKTGGGGVLVMASNAAIINSTISENTVRSSSGIGVGVGGGLRVETGSIVTLESTTITENTSDSGGGVSTGGGVIEISFRNNVISKNYADGGSSVNNCAIGGGTEFVSAGRNLSDDTTCFLDHPTDVIAGDARLSSLGLYGGLTPVHMPLTGSPAIDTGGRECSRVDQRGFLRPADGNGDGVVRCDRGAVEVGAVPYPHPRSSSGRRQP
jgi:hypothetical protein